LSKEDLAVLLKQGKGRPRKKLVEKLVIQGEKKGEDRNVLNAVRIGSKGKTNRRQRGPKPGGKIGKKEPNQKFLWGKKLGAKRDKRGRVSQKKPGQKSHRWGQKRGNFR